MKQVGFSLEHGNRYYGRIDGRRFLIGQRVSHAGCKGLINCHGTSAERYERAQYRERYGFWADFIHPTAMAEGGVFHAANTCDRAQFTFSFLQFGAHVPNGAFVRLLRELLKLPPAADYFPDLALVDGRVCRVDGNGKRVLETDTSTAGLLDYLNPSALEVEDTEVIQLARFVHWARCDKAHRDLQVAVGIDEFRGAMLQHARRYALDGAPDVLCLLVADIRHQGRARSPAIVAALAAADPEAALLAIGEQAYPARIRTLRREIARLRAEGRLGTRRYSIARADFEAQPSAGGQAFAGGDEGVVSAS